MYVCVPALPLLDAPAPTEESVRMYVCVCAYDYMYISVCVTERENVYANDTTSALERLSLSLFFCCAYSVD
jgi:hypothetical protein